MTSKMVGTVAYNQHQQLVRQTSSKMGSPTSTLSMGYTETFSDDDDDADSQYVSYMDNDPFIESDEDGEYTPRSSPHLQHYISNNSSSCNSTATNAAVSQMKRKHNDNANTGLIVVQRQPTRRPNPKIHNRNALMARENRKKKKEHVETLERDVDILRLENDTLRQLLTKRSTTVHRLREERLYLKSVIANKTSIMQLLQTIRGNRLPMTSSTLSFCVADDNNADAEAVDAADGPAPKRPKLEREQLEQSNIFKHNNDLKYRTATESALFLSDGLSPVHDMEFPALPWQAEMLNANDDVFRPDDMFAVDDAVLWNGPSHSETDTVDGLDDEPDVKCIAGDRPQQMQQIKVSHEHNYSNNHINEQSRSSLGHDHNDNNNNDDDNATIFASHAADNNSTCSMAEHLHRGGKVRPKAASTAIATPTIQLSGPSANSVPTSAAPGICLHLSGGRVSLEFCISCHRHAQNAWDEEGDDDSDDDNGEKALL